MQDNEAVVRMHTEFTGHRDEWGCHGRIHPEMGELLATVIGHERGLREQNVLVAAAERIELR